MKTQTYENLTKQANTTLSNVLCKLLIIALPLSFTTISIANDSFHDNPLFNPDANLLEMESTAHIIIYDGLPNKIVERALDQQFDRIENMMFTRIRYNDDNEVITEDDDC